MERRADSPTITDYTVRLAVIGATDSGTWNNALLKITTGPSTNTRVTNVYEVSIDLTYNINVSDETGSSGARISGTVNDFQYTSNPVTGIIGTLGSGSATRGLVYFNEGSGGTIAGGIARAYVNGQSINVITNNMPDPSGGVILNVPQNAPFRYVIYRPTITAVGVKGDGIAVCTTRYRPDYFSLQEEW